MDGESYGICEKYQLFPIAGSGKMNTSRFSVLKRESVVAYEIARTASHHHLETSSSDCK
jgi:hypothetical protein